MHRVRDGQEAHSPELYRKLADLGWLGVSIPQKYGGAGCGIIDHCLFIESAWYGLAPTYDLRRHERDPARHHRQDVRPLKWCAPR
jgi:alkylation response protein AidB-like acyl-CoA dehydrogenase